MTVESIIEDWISNRDLEQLLDKYEFNEIIGKGVSCTVRRCCDRYTKTEYAVKIIDINSGVDNPELLRAECHREIEILRLVAGHPNIIELHDVVQSDAFVFLFFELCKKGELFDLLTEKVKLSEKRSRFFMRQIYDGLAHIHSKNVVHRDIKPENILLAENDTVKITDFGLAVMQDDTDELKEARGTRGYLAPEVLRVGYYDDAPPYGKPVDVWATAVILYTMMAGYPPFWNRKEHLALRQIYQCRYEFTSPEWDDVSECVKDLIRRILVLDVSQRLTVHEALCHEFVSGSGAAAADQLEPAKKRNRFKIAAYSALFIVILRKMASQVVSVSVDFLRENPYFDRRLRKLIDSTVFNIYSHWVKKGEDQNRAALFQNFPKRDNAASSSANSVDAAAVSSLS